MVHVLVPASPHDITDGTIPPFPPPCVAQHVGEPCPECEAWYEAVEQINDKLDVATNHGREGHGEEAAILAAYLADQGLVRVVVTGEGTEGDAEYRRFFHEQADDGVPRASFDVGSLMYRRAMGEMMMRSVRSWR